MGGEALHAYKKYQVRVSQSRVVVPNIRVVRAQERVLRFHENRTTHYPGAAAILSKLCFSTHTVLLASEYFLYHPKPS
jgi:hypothetical protein